LWMKFNLFCRMIQKKPLNFFESEVVPIMAKKTAVEHLGMNENG
jgi:hypothetical protein